MFFVAPFSLCSAIAGGGASSQFFLFPFDDPTSASETFEIPAAIVSIFFLLAESLTPPDNLLAGDSDILLALGDPCLLPFGDAWRYLDGTMIAASLDVLRFSSRAETRLGTTHFDGTGDADRFDFPAGDGSLSTTAGFFFPTDADRG